MAFTVTVEAVPGGDSYELEDGTGHYVLEDGSGVYRAESVYVDLSSYLLFGTVTQRFNTLDFSLEAPPANSTQLGAVVRTTDPTWAGVITRSMSSDHADIVGLPAITTCTATNASTVPSDTAPFDLTDTGNDVRLLYQLEDWSGHFLLEDGSGIYVGEDAASDLLLEDGSGHLLIETGNDFAPGAVLLEATLPQPYRSLSVERISQTSGAPQTLGRVTTLSPGLRVGNLFRLTSRNQGFSGAAFQITQRVVTWMRSDLPVFALEFGDTAATLAAWAAANAPPTPAQTSAPALTAPATTTVGKATAQTGIFAMGGGIVTIATATFSAAADTGHTLTCQVQGAVDARMEAWDNYIAAPRRGVRAILTSLYTGAWQELPFGLTRSVYDLSSASGIAMASGTYTVSLQIDTQEYNQMHVYSGWVQVVITQV